ncbi:tryptophan synthase subunit alpha, partial [Escherichia sp. TWPC-MK]
DLLRQIASYGRGYTYLLSRAGVTGAENRAALPLNHLVAKLKEYNAAPPLQGFGISAPDQVKAAIDAGAAGAISGSAIVKIIEQHINEPEKMLAAVGLTARRRFYRLYKNFQCRQHFLWLINIIKQINPAT